MGMFSYATPATSRQSSLNPKAAEFTTSGGTSNGGSDIWGVSSFFSTPHPAGDDASAEDISDTGPIAMVDDLVADQQPHDIVRLASVVAAHEQTIHDLRRMISDIQEAYRSVLTDFQTLKTAHFALLEQGYESCDAEKVDGGLAEHVRRKLEAAELTELFENEFGCLDGCLVAPPSVIEREGLFGMW